MKLLKAISLFAILASISGCALLGMSINDLQDEKVKFSKVFDKDAAYCFDRTIEALDKWEAHVFQRSDIFDKNNKRCIVATNLNKVFNSCINTTEVGIFFNKASDGSTQVEVASLNHQLAQFVSENLFKYIEDPKAKTCPIIKEKIFEF